MSECNSENNQKKNRSKVPFIVAFIVILIIFIPLLYLTYAINPAKGKIELCSVNVGLANDSTSSHVENICVNNLLYHPDSNEESIPLGYAYTTYFNVIFLFLIAILILLQLWRKENHGYNSKRKFKEEILEEELKFIEKKRKHLWGETGDETPGKNLFGIALSGGGLRSATINLGVMKILNHFGILAKADYLSTVSGGSYIGGYIQSKILQNNPKANSNKKKNAGEHPFVYDDLFTREDIKHQQKEADIPCPGKGARKWLLSPFILGAALLKSFLMNFILIALLFTCCFIILQFISPYTYEVILGIERGEIAKWLIRAAAVVFAIHYILGYVVYSKIVIRAYHIKIVKILEGYALFLVLLYYIHKGIGIVNPFMLLIIGCVLIIYSLLFNPNFFSMHSFYRDRIAEIFLRNMKRVKLSELIKKENNPGKKMAPYPLINTCLNILGNNREGASENYSDYFLLSPLFCGSHSTGWTSTIMRGYKNMTLATALSVSGAALNPNMGTRTNRILSFFMSMCGIKTGYWAVNPKFSRFFPVNIIFWSYYLFLELISQTNTKRLRINISDGGHIENLGVFELLRRECKLIIAVDCGADPGFEFDDLRNLVIRAKNQLHFDIKFRPGLEPESIIKAQASSGFSNSHFAIADITGCSKKGNKKSEESQSEEYKGILVYLKSSLLDPCTAKNVEQNTKNEAISYDYKTYHPNFPHETTIDQSYSNCQWKAYYHLGIMMAGKLLQAVIEQIIKEKNVKGTHAVEELRKKTFDELYDYFDKLEPIQ